MEYAADAVRLKVTAPTYPRFLSDRTAVSGGKLHLEWTGAGTLVAADQVTGSYEVVAGVSGNPADIPIDRAQRFFRIRQ